MEEQRTKMLEAAFDEGRMEVLEEIEAKVNEFKKLADTISKDDAERFVRYMFDAWNRKIVAYKALINN